MVHVNIAIVVFVIYLCKLCLFVTVIKCEASVRSLHSNLGPKAFNNMCTRLQRKSPLELFGQQKYLHATLIKY